MHLHHRRAGTSARLSVAPRRPRTSIGITAALVITSACVVVAVAATPAAAAFANRAPIAVDEAFVLDPDTVLAGNLKVNDFDPDGDGMTFSPVQLPLHGSLSLNNSGTFYYTPDAGYVGLDSFIYQLKDPDGVLSREATATFGTGVPLVAADDLAFTPGTPVTIDVLANDASLGGGARVVATGPGTHGSVALNHDGTLTYTPDAGFTGIDIFSYVIDDHSDADSVSAHVTVTVTNGAPVAHDDAASTPTSTPVTVDVLANDTDPNSDPITIVSGSVTTPVDGAGHATGTAVIDSGAALYTPPAGFCGSVTFDYQVTDGDAADTATHTATVTVTVTNAPPVAHDDTASTPTNTAVTVDVLANDTDPNLGATTQALVTSGLTTDHGATVVSNADHTLTITPATGYKGPITVTYTVADGAGGTDTGELVVTVRNAPPVAHDDAATTPYGTAVGIPVLDNDTDANGDAIAVVTGSVTPPVTSGGATRGTVTVAGGVATYTPPAGFSGVVTFDCTVTDGADTDTATVTVTVGNAPPVAAPDAVTTKPGAPITIDVTGNDGDPDGGTLVVTGFTQPTSGTVTLVEGRLVYTPAPGFSGTVTFTYTASDGQGGTTTGTVTVVVTADAGSPGDGSSAGSPSSGSPSGNALARTGTEIDLTAAVAALLLAAGLTLVVAARRRRA